MLERPTVTLTWKIVTVLPSEPPLNLKDAFNSSANTGLFSRFGISPGDAYVPMSLLPTVRFHQALRNFLQNRCELQITEKKFPYEIFIPRFECKATVNLRVRLFLPSILSVTVSVSPVQKELDPQWLIASQNFGSYAPLVHVVRCTSEMAQTMNHRISAQPNFQNRFRIIKPLVHLAGVSPPERFRAHLDQNLSKYVGILIRNRTYEGMDRSISDRVMAKNAEHNLKSSDRLLLISKQGVLSILPSGQPDASVLENVRRIYDLMEIALVCDAYLEAFDTLRAANEDLADFFLYKIRTLIEKPDLLFRKSVTNRIIWSQLCDDFMLKQHMEHRFGNLAQSISEKEKSFGQFREWWKISDFSHVLSRSVVEGSEFHFRFIDDADFKRMIIDDYVEARRSLAVKNYKAAIVLCGSISEAILTFVVAKIDSNVDTEVLYRKGFDELIKAIKDRGIIKDPSLLSLLESIRLYRNMIHPGRAKRLGLTANSSNAQVALETVNLLVKEVERFLLDRFSTASGTKSQPPK
jgi:hypothetical protein